jgi:hypothetical protein
LALVRGGFAANTQCEISKIKSQLFANFFDRTFLKFQNGFDRNRMLGEVVIEKKITVRQIFSHFLCPLEEQISHCIDGLMGRIFTTRLQTQTSK